MKTILILIWIKKSYLAKIYNKINNNSLKYQWLEVLFIEITIILKRIIEKISKILIKCPILKLIKYLNLIQKIII
jgi:hypothetical protein